MSVVVKNFDSNGELVIEDESKQVRKNPKRSHRVSVDYRGRSYTPIGDTIRKKYIVTKDNDFKLVEKSDIQDLIQSAYKMSDSDIYSILEAVSTGQRVIEPGGEYYDTSNVPTSIYEARKAVDLTAANLLQSYVDEEKIKKQAAIEAEKPIEKDIENGK